MTEKTSIEARTPEGLPDVIRHYIDGQLVDSMTLPVNASRPRGVEFDDTEGDVLDGVRVSREFVLGLGAAA